MSVKITRELVKSLNQEDLMKAISRNIFPTDLRLGTNASKQNKMTDSSFLVGDNGVSNGHHEEHLDNEDIQQIMNAKCFNGHQRVYKHYSKETNCHMKFSIYLPESSTPNEKFHVVIFLSGIMCNEQNFLFKSAFQQYASEKKLIVVGADTSPRGFEYPGDRDAPIFGRSAGWYLDATEEPWSKNYRMYSYISQELPGIIKNNFPTTEKFGLIGHSMGGNGTVVIGLRNPAVFKCLSLLAPSCNPTSWGQELIYKKFLGDNEDLWKLYDASHVITQYDGPLREILLDQGADDQYLDFLLPERLKKCAESNPNKSVSVELEIQEGHDHSYFFVASFIEKHLEYQKNMLDKATF